MSRRPDSVYRPVDCSLHDRYESWAVQRTVLTVRWTDDSGEARNAESRITDIQVKDGAEFLVLASGDVIRLDRLTSVAPTAPGS